MIKLNIYICAFYLLTNILFSGAPMGIPKAEAQNSGMENSAIGLIYHRFGEDKYPTTNVSIEQIDMHINELTSGNYNVIPLMDAVTTLQSGKKLPARSIIITVDDAFVSFYKNGWPRFKAAKLPVTLFVSTASVDGNEYGYLSWEQLREMKNEGLDIQAHSHHHYHLAGRDATETKREIETSRDRIKQELGIDSKIFAYPYGEASLTLMNQVKNAGFIAGLGQHSGGMTSYSNPWYLPRFPVNMRYGEQDRFKQVINSIGLPVTDMLPADPLLTKDETTNPPAIGFTIAEGVPHITELACYHSQTGSVNQMEWLGKRHVELRFNQAFSAGRTRVNCTVPATDGRWYWLGTQYYLKSN